MREIKSSQYTLFSDFVLPYQNSGNAKKMLNVSANVFNAVGAENFGHSGEGSWRFAKFERVAS